MSLETLYMIGNSHIDPVWFWDWDEGLQEVKATFRSALDRLREDPEVKFTATSSCFFEWIEAVCPEMFEEIRQRVREGRFELTGGWFLEPDCILPCGEAFVRQGLYAQRYFREKFGKICRTGSNVDSFGHNPILPQLLQKSGLEEYVFMRPRLKEPVFVWESPDKSRVTAVSLPSEYTTWFYEKTREAAEMAREAAKKQGLSSIPCCYGVGNHGGGPTKENITAVRQLRAELKETRLVFGSYREFFDSLTEKERERLPVKQAFFDKINTGCYSMDGELKRENRTAEGRLFQAEAMLVLARLYSGGRFEVREKEQVRKLWKTLLFNQFHDTLGGTAVRQARDEAVRQLGSVSAGAKRLWALAMQRIMNRTDTRGEGFPLFLFNPTGRDWDGPVAIELDWFCKDGLVLRDPEGREVAYQRVHTAAKVRNYNLGGRRGIVFHAHIPALGFSVYRTEIGTPALECDSRESGGKWLLTADASSSPAEETAGPVLENGFVRAVFDRQGFLCSLTDRETGYEALSGPVRFPVWQDERDTWGGDQGRPYRPTGEQLRFESLQLVEEGSCRKILRATYRLGGSVLFQEYALYPDSRELEIRSRLLWDRPWQMLRMELPLAVTDNYTFQETAYGVWGRSIPDGDEYSMHRFVDVTQEKSAGLCLANDGKYAFSLRENALSVPLARSAIFAQGNGKDWYNPSEGYEYADLGEQRFTFTLRPHGRALAPGERLLQARRCASPILAMADNCHPGERRANRWTGLCLPEENVECVWVKPSEDGDEIVLRLLETGGKKTAGRLVLAGTEYPYGIGAYEILTLLVNEEGCQSVNLLEWAGKEME